MRSRVGGRRRLEFELQQSAWHAMADWQGTFAPSNFEKRQVERMIGIPGWRPRQQLLPRVQRAHQTPRGCVPAAVQSASCRRPVVWAWQCTLAPTGRTNADRSGWLLPVRETPGSVAVQVAGLPILAQWVGRTKTGQHERPTPPRASARGPRLVSLHPTGQRLHW